MDAVYGPGLNGHGEYCRLRLGVGALHADEIETQSDGDGTKKNFASDDSAMEV